MKYFIIVFISMISCSCATIDKKCEHGFGEPYDGLKSSIKFQSSYCSWLVFYVFPPLIVALPPIASCIIATDAVACTVLLPIDLTIKLNPQYTSTAQRDFEKSKLQDAEKIAFLQAAKIYPSIVISERWLDNYWDNRSQVVHKSMKHGDIPFSQDQLSELYQAWRYPLVFLHPACTEDFITQHFDSALESAKKFNSYEIDAMISNHITPIALVEQVAATDKLLSNSVVDRAKKTIEERLRIDKKMNLDKAVDSTTTSTTSASEKGIE